MPRVLAAARYLGRPIGTLFVFDLLVAIAYVELGWEWVSLPNLPITVLGGAIGVIISLRNQNSYGRWWEARQLWGSIVNDSRSFARQAWAAIGAPSSAGDSERTEAAQARRELLILQIAYTVALRSRLRDSSPLEELARLLPAREAETIARTDNPPLAIQRAQAARLRRCKEKGWLDAFAWLNLDRALTRMMDWQGGMERIKNTPMPEQYNFFPNLFVRAYCLFLPLGIVHSLRFLTPFGSTLVGFVFLVMERIGRDLEAPFAVGPNHLPLDDYTNTIESDIRDLFAGGSPGEGESPGRQAS